MIVQESSTESDSDTLQPPKDDKNNYYNRKTNEEQTKQKINYYSPRNSNC